MSSWAYQGFIILIVCTRSAPVRTGGAGSASIGGVGLDQQTRAAQSLGRGAVANLLEEGEPAGAVEAHTGDGQVVDIRVSVASAFMRVGSLNRQPGAGSEPAPRIVGADLETHLPLEGMGGTDDGDGEQHWANLSRTAVTWLGVSPHRRRGHRPRHRPENHGRIYSSPTEQSHIAPAAAYAEAPANGSHATVSMRLKVPVGLGLVWVGLVGVWGVGVSGGRCR